MIDPYIKLVAQIDYTFTDVALLQQALTHRSAAKKHNERLEFLGDAVLGLVIAQRVFEKFPTLPEGKLTRMRSNLVKGETLAKVARELSLGDLIKLGPGEMKSGGRRRDSILADAVEAVLGAIYVESGLDAATVSIDKLFDLRIKALDPDEQIKDNKTQLQEYLQGRQLDLPDYQVVEIKGKDHAQTFTVKCNVAALEVHKTGVGKSRRIAEQEAAKLILESLPL
ncbi:MAG: ribonuclease-3 [Alphaproteobacteria bacterium]